MKTIDLTKGNPSKVLIMFAIPMILSVTLQQIYNIADSSIAGTFIGSDALAAVSASYPITMIYLSFATGIGVGTGVITSRFFGAKDYKNSKTAIYTSLFFTLFLAIIISIIGILITNASLRLIETPDNIFNDSSIYLKFYCGGLVFTFLYNVISCIFQSLGNSKTPLYFLLFSTIFNILLDLLFVCVCKMSVLGLALGTFIAQGVAMTFSLLFLLINLKKFYSEESSKLFDAKILGQILQIAIPSVIQGATISVGNFFIQKRINSYGSELIAGYGAAYKLCYVIVNIFTAYSNAISNYTSQNIGASNETRILKGFKASLLICIIFSFVMSIILCSMPNLLLKIFMDNSNEASLNYAKGFIYIVAPFFIFMGLKIPSDGVLKGSKDMFGFMFGTLIDLILRIALSYILSYYYGYVGIFIAWPISWAAGTIISIIFFFSNRWKRKAGFSN